MMFANILASNLKQNPKIKYIQELSEESGALYLLIHCFENFLNQFDSTKLKQLSTHPQILDINFPSFFKENLSRSLNSKERKKLFYDSLETAINTGKPESLKYIRTIANQMRFDAGTKCLKNIGLQAIADNIININSLLAVDLKHNDMLWIMQKDSIVDSIFELFKIVESKIPTDVMQLYHMLEATGPLLIKGTFGIDSYRPNTAILLSTINDVQIYGWNKSNYMEDSDSSLHATIIIGVKHDAMKPENSRVYFVDPRQSLNPNQKYKIAYSVSFSKYISNVKNIFYISEYGLTQEIMAQEAKNIMNPSGLKAGFLNIKPIDLQPDKVVNTAPKFTK